MTKFNITARPLYRCQNDTVQSAGISGRGLGHGAHLVLIYQHLFQTSPNLFDAQIGIHQHARPCLQDASLARRGRADSLALALKDCLKIVRPRSHTG